MMLKTYRKKRAAISQLRKASRFANEVLVRKHILAEDNIIAKLAASPKAPKLPGVPPYLPRPYTLDWARVLMTIILKKWLLKCGVDRELREDIRGFVLFAIRRMEDEERKWTLRMRSTDLEEVKDETLAKIFLPVQAKEAAQSLKIFMVDMFNRSSIVTQCGTVSEFVDEFDRETLMMKDLWVAEEKRRASKLGPRPKRKRRPRQNGVHKK